MGDSYSEMVLKARVRVEQLLTNHFLILQWNSPLVKPVPQFAYNNIT